MKVTLTNLSNDKFKDSRKRLNKSALKFGVDIIKSYNFKDIINTSFYKENYNILSQPTGSGYWLWKPYIILETLKNVEEGDIVIYSDCGIQIIANLAPLIEICKNKSEILLFSNGNNQNKIWTKSDCFILMDCHEEKYWDGLQCDAAFCLFKKNIKTITFLEEWLKFSSNPNILTDLENINCKPNFPDFIEHRRDQSILSLLSIKHNITLYRMPSQWGNLFKSFEFRIDKDFKNFNHLSHKQNIEYNVPLTDSPYYQLLYHHRTPNTNILQKAKSIIKKLLKSIIK